LRETAGSREFPSKTTKGKPGHQFQAKPDMSAIDHPTGSGNRTTPPANDFPYYNGIPARITGPQWWFVMLIVAIGFAVLVAPIPAFASRLGRFVPAILFFAIPLIGLRLVAGKHWTAIFRKLRVRDFLWMIAFALLNVVVALVVGSLVMKLFGAEANSALAGLADQTVGERVLFFLKAAIQLFGEEVLSILPFLAVMYLFFSHLRCSRTKAILAAWLLSAVIFGLAHLPTYNWNVVQCLLVIGSARLVLTLPYMLTKNIWVSTGAHILNDFVTFGISIVGASAAAAG